MMSRRWLGGPKPPKNPHSLEHLKYLHYVLTKNSTVTEGNKALIVEALRSMSEILIWGDQNDSSVFEFYLEKNMFLFFLNILGQNAGNYVCVQLLQTLNILFENLQNDTSLYYLLSNNHVNEVICHKFDFSDEEVLAYYISFLKTLSLKLNKHTIHFFYNEHTDDFALYTEAIKFFNHSESMVRIAVRTLTLNVYKVEEEAMLRYIRDRTAVPYFSNLVWFIGNHVRQLNACVRNNDNHEHRNRLDVLVAEHLDHLHYLNDILSIRNDLLNGILGEHLLSRLFVPLYIYSLTSMGDEDSDEQEQPKVNSVVALFLLSQVFLIIHYEPLVHKLAEVIFNPTTLLTGDAEKDKLYQVFLTPPESLETLLASKRKKSGRRKKRPNFRNVGSDEEGHSQQTLIEQNYTVEEVEKSSSKHVAIDSPAYSDDSLSYSSSSVLSGGNSSSNEHSDSHAIPPTRNITDEEKAAAAAAASRLSSSSSSISTNRPFLDTIYSALNCKDNDYSALFALCLLYAMQHNKGINSNLKEVIKLGGEITEEESEETYSHWLVERLLRILSTSVRPDSKVRLSTLRLSCLLLKEIGLKNGDCILLENHLNCIEDARNESMECLHTFYKEEEIFLDIFEDEYRTYQNKPLNVEYMMMDHSLLLPPTGTPLTGIDFSNRLPCGPAEKAKRAIGSFISLRDLSLALCKEVETQLPLTRSQDCIQNNDKLDLNNSDLIACTVSSRDGRQRRFLVVDLYQLVLVEPETKRLGWGVVKFAGFLQDVEVTSDNEDSRVLRVTIHKPSGARRLPLLSADFIFDDHIRCMAAKQRLTKGRMRARHLKMQRIAVLIGLPENAVEDPFANNYMLNTGFQASRSQFHAYAEPQAVEVSSGIRSSHAPQPILKRPGRAATSVSPGFPGRIGSLGLPTSPRSHPARSSSPALQLPTSKKKSKTKQKKSLPASDSSPDLLLNLPTDGSNIINDLQPVIDGNVITREFIKGHRKTNSGHISSSLLPYEEVGIPVGKLESDTISCGSSASIGNDIKGLEEGVDASSLNEFSIEDDPAKSPQDSVKIPQDSVNVDHMSAEASELSKDNQAEVVFAESLSLDSKSPATTEKLESSHLETDDSKAARLNTDPVNTFSTNFKDLAPALQPPSSAPASLMFQQAPKFDVSISPVRKPSLQIVPTTE